MNNNTGPFWEDIKRLVNLMKEGNLTEYDYDEVAEKYNTTREEVIQCCISEATYQDMKK